LHTFLCILKHLPSPVAGRTAAVIRQISNPMASTDFTLLALAGIGHRGNRAFGFVSCNRVVGAAEGMNVLREECIRTPSGTCSHPGNENINPNNGVAPAVFACGISNVEYTEFQRLGISDQAVEEGSNESAFPANTNILYVGALLSLQTIASSYEASAQSAPQLTLVSLADITGLQTTLGYILCMSTHPATSRKRPVMNRNKVN
jgi:hypothetical protein